MTPYNLLYSVLLDQSKDDPHADAIVDGINDRVIPYSRLLTSINGIHGKLAAEASDGLPIISLLPNSSEALLCFLAAMSGGMTYAPIAPDSTLQEILAWGSLIGAGHVLIPDSLDEEIKRGLQERFSLMVVPSDGSDDWFRHEENIRGTGQAGTLLVKTSGSTGDAKAMVIDGDRLWKSGQAFSRSYSFIDGGSRFLNLLPMSYLGGLFNLGLIPLASGGATVIVEAFSGKTFLSFWQIVERFEINVIWLVPSILKGLLTLGAKLKLKEGQENYLGVKGCLLGTAPVELKSKLRFEEIFRIPVYENYALSETTFLTAESDDDRERRTENSKGQVLPYVDLLLRPLEGEERNNAVGAVYAKTPFLFKGYLKSSGEVELAVDETGYFATGDIGSFDDHGQLVIQGRARDIIKKGGHMVGLREIEVLAESNGEVREAAAVKIDHQYYGESYNLYIVLHSKDSNLDDVRRWLHTHLVKYKWPEEVFEAPGLPRTPSGKIKKHELGPSRAPESGGATTP